MQRKIRHVSDFLLECDEEREKKEEDVDNKDNTEDETVQEN